MLAGTFLKDILGDRYCGKNVRPAGVKEQVCERLRSFGFRQAVIHRPVEVSRQLRHLSCCDESDESTDGNEAPVPRRKRGRSHRSRNSGAVV
jgi:hypothetical protein